MPNKEFSAYGGDKIIDLENENVVDAFSEAIGGGEGSSDKEIICYGILTHGEDKDFYKLSFDFSTESNWEPDWVTVDKLKELKTEIGCFPLIKAILIGEGNFALVCDTVKPSTDDLSNNSYFDPILLAALNATSDMAHIYDPTIAFFNTNFYNPTDDNEEWGNYILTCSLGIEYPIRINITEGYFYFSDGEGTQASPYITETTEKKFIKIRDNFYIGRLVFDASDLSTKPVALIASTMTSYTFIAYDASGTLKYFQIELQE